MQMSVMTGRVLPQGEAAALARQESRAAAFLAASLGAVLLLGVGFLQIPAVHDAAHDTRHAIGFPCH